MESEEVLSRLMNLLKDGRFLEAIKKPFDNFFIFEQDTPIGETRYGIPYQSYLDVSVSIKPEFITKEFVLAVAKGILKNPDYLDLSSHYETFYLLKKRDFKQFIGDTDPVAEEAYRSFIEELKKGEFTWMKFNIIPDSFFLEEKRRSELENSILQYVRTTDVRDDRMFGVISQLKNKSLIPLHNEGLQSQLKDTLKERLSHYFEKYSYNTDSRAGVYISSLVELKVLSGEEVIEVLDPVLENIPYIALIDLCVADLLLSADPYVNRKRIYPFLNRAVDCVTDDSTLMYLEEVLVPNMAKLMSYGDGDHGWNIEQRIKKGLMIRFISDLTNTNMNVAYNEELATRYNDLLSKV